MPPKGFRVDKYSIKKLISVIWNLVLGKQGQKCETA